MNIRKDVQQMLDRDGLYLAFDPNHAQFVPIVSRGGKLFSMMIDNARISTFIAINLVTLDRRLEARENFPVIITSLHTV